MPKHFLTKGFTTLLLLSFASHAFANVEQQLGFWAKISKAALFSETTPLGYELIAENRQYNNHSADNLFNIGGFLTYQATSKQQFAIGYQFFHAYDDPAMGGRNENRINQRWRINLPTKQNKLFLQSMLQERQREQMSQWNYRVREKLEYHIPIHTWRIETYDEIFLNLNNPVWVVNTFLSENRAFLGVNYAFNQKTSFKIGYVNRYVAGDNSNDRMQNILAVELNFS